MPTSRREFLALTGAAAIAGVVPGALRAESGAWSLESGVVRADRIKKIGLQLYTVRDLMKDDFDGTIAQVAKIGYQEVEFAGYFGKTAPAVRKILDANGLVSPSSHVAIEDLEKDPNAIFDYARTVGHEWVIIAWLDEDRRNTVAALHQVADEFNAIGEKARAAGLRFAYHNHNPEFTPIEGQLPYDIFLSRTDPALVQFEMDLYWIVNGGGDPLTYFAKYPGRFPLVHVKDMTKDRKMVDVGQGAIDWKTIFAHAKQAGIEHYFVEHDEPPMPLADIRTSFEYLRALRF
ncbi:MAG TPA: TIM barrel protein [Gemmatimonadales bacterium]|nr:TIM barrel protein [Gemmatimonadales bacterium]